MQRSRAGSVLPGMDAQTNRKGGGWQIWVGLFVAFGSLVTIGYAVVETFWG